MKESLNRSMLIGAPCIKAEISRVNRLPGSRKSPRLIKIHGKTMSVSYRGWKGVRERAIRARFNQACLPASQRARSLAVSPQ